MREEKYFALMRQEKYFAPLRRKSSLMYEGGKTFCTYEGGTVEGMEQERVQTQLLEIFDTNIY